MSESDDWMTADFKADLGRVMGAVASNSPSTVFVAGGGGDKHAAWAMTIILTGRGDDMAAGLLRQFADLLSELSTTHKTVKTSELAIRGFVEKLKELKAGENLRLPAGDA